MLSVPPFGILPVTPTLTSWQKRTTKTAQAVLARHGFPKRDSIACGALIQAFTLQEKGLTTTCLIIEEINFYVVFTYSTLTAPQAIPFKDPQ